MISYFFKSAKDKEISQLTEFKDGSWINVVDPTTDDINFLETEFGLDKGLLKDATDENEVPRYEVDNKTIYIYMRFPPIQEENIVTSPILIAVGEKFVLTSGRNTETITASLHQKKQLNTSNKISFVLSPLTIINSEYQTYLRDISKKVRTSTIKLEKIRNKDIVRFVIFENVLNDFLSALVPSSTILNHLLAGRHLPLTEKELDIVEDLKLSNIEIVEISKTTLRAMVNIREAYSTIVTNNLNDIIKLLTSLTVILAVPTMISSFFGMNVPLSFAQSPFMFLGIVLSSIFISVSLIIVFIKKDWI